MPLTILLLHMLQRQKEALIKKMSPDMQQTGVEPWQHSHQQMFIKCMMPGLGQYRQASALNKLQ